MSGRFIDFGPKASGKLSNLNLTYYKETQTYYYITVKAINGAGLVSTTLSSWRIKLLRQNKPGIVYDGGKEYVDAQFQQDNSVIAFSFGGFESEAL